MVILLSFISIYTATRPPTRAVKPFNTKSPSAQPGNSAITDASNMIREAVPKLARHWWKVTKNPNRY